MSLCVILEMTYECIAALRYTRGRSPIDENGNADSEVPKDRLFNVKINVQLFLSPECIPVISYI